MFFHQAMFELSIIVSIFGGIAGESAFILLFCDQVFAIANYVYKICLSSGYLSEYQVIGLIFFSLSVLTFHFAALVRLFYTTNYNVKRRKKQRRKKKINPFIVPCLYQVQLRIDEKVL